MVNTPVGTIMTYFVKHDMKLKWLKLICYITILNFCNLHIMCEDIEISDKNHKQGRTSTIKKLTLGHYHSNETFALCPGKTKVISLKQVNDLIPDCDSNADEPILYSLLTNSSYEFPTGSAIKDENFCFYGHPKTYSNDEKCLYEVDDNGLLQTCRNGKHLQNCKDFNCITVVLQLVNSSVLVIFVQKK